MYDLDTPEEGLATFSGMMLRSQLVLLLINKAFGERDGEVVRADSLVRIQRSCVAVARVCREWAVGVVKRERSNKSGRENDQQKELWRARDSGCVVRVGAVLPRNLQ